MPQFTPNYRIPYPVDGDPIWQGAQQMKALAMTVDKTMTGVSGIPGPAGPTGPAGPQGKQGPAGPTGLTGPAGPQGPRGATGERGPAGPAGERGPSGADGTGFTLLGSVASTSQLPASPKPGDAYLVNNSVHVWTGKSWSNVGSIQGPAGPAGERGPQGEPGLAGATGPQGEPGPQGATGARGATGAQGPTGPAGPQGKQGPTGPTGPAGPQGPAGATPPIYAGTLRWQPGWYDPIGGRFTRLRTTSDGKLYVARNVGGVAANDGNNPRLVAGVSGYYALSASQTWINGGAIKGCGLTTSISDGGKGVQLWLDNNQTQIINGSVVRYLDAGTILYPWTFQVDRAGLSGGDREMPSEYSLVLLQSF